MGDDYEDPYDEAYLLTKDPVQRYIRWAIQEFVEDYADRKHELFSGRMHQNKELYYQFLEADDKEYTDKISKEGRNKA